jgi:glutamate 5-kinase
VIVRRLSDYRTIVVKVGSSLLVNPVSGRLDSGWLAALADDIAGLARDERRMLVVSSGAIALGRPSLGSKRGPLKLEEAQAAAAIGQIALASAWAECLGARGLKAAQVLLTLGDTEERRRYLNARATLGTLCREGDRAGHQRKRYGGHGRDSLR